MYPTSIDGKPSAGGFRMPHQTVRVFRTGFSRSDREFEEILTPCRQASVFRHGEAKHQPECVQKTGADSRRIEQAASEGWLDVVSVATKRSHPPSLGIGEVESIQLALETEKALLIMDDRLARREATRHGLNYIGTVRMLHLAEQRSIVDNAEATIQRMAECGYRISPLILRQLRAQTSGDAPYSD